MSDDRKKALWPSIMALLIGLPVLYVASFGPACWYASHYVENHARPPKPWIGCVYFPLGQLAICGPPSIAGQLRKFASAYIPPRPAATYVPGDLTRWYFFTDRWAIGRDGATYWIGE